MREIENHNLDANISVMGQGVTATNNDASTIGSLSQFKANGNGSARKRSDKGNAMLDMGIIHKCRY